MDRKMEIAAMTKGAMVQCKDPSNGGHFLRLDQIYHVDRQQTDDKGIIRICLVGMARAWEASRFVLIWAAPPSNPKPVTPQQHKLAWVQALETAAQGILDLSNICPHGHPMRQFCTRCQPIFAAGELLSLLAENEASRINQEYELPPLDDADVELAWQRAEELWPAVAPMPEPLSLDMIDPDGRR